MYKLEPFNAARRPNPPAGVHKRLAELAARKPQQRRGAKIDRDARRAVKREAIRAAVRNGTIKPRAAQR